MLLKSCRAVVSCRRPSSVVLAALVLLLSACSRPAPAPEPLRSVKLVTLGAHPLGVQADYAAEVRARVESRLGFRVGGKLVQRPAEVGQSYIPGKNDSKSDSSFESRSSERLLLCVICAVLCNTR
ncbi:MAG: hypothetical protein ACKOFG_16155, partial [Limnohabitans sp.]